MLHSSPSFTVIVSDADGSGAGVVPAFTLNSGVATISDFDTFPTRTTGLQAFTAAGVLIPGLLFSATYDIGGIASTADGTGYVVANTSVSLTKASVTTDVGAGNFSFDEQESEFNNASGVITINNEDAFEALNPTTGAQLPGLLFARYPGALGNSLGTYVIDAASWSAAPAAIKAQFDAAPTGTEVHVYVYDELVLSLVLLDPNSKSGHSLTQQLEISLLTVQTTTIKMSLMQVLITSMLVVILLVVLQHTALLVV